MIPPGPESMTGLRGQPPPQLVFGPFELDSSRRVLNRGAEAVDLPDWYFDPLLLLESHAGQILTKQNLFESIWHDVAARVCHEAVHTSSLKHLLALPRRRPLKASHPRRSPPRRVRHRRRLRRLRIRGRG